MKEIKKIYELLDDVKEKHIDKINKELSIDTIESIKMLLNDLETIDVWNNKNKKLNWK